MWLFVMEKNGNYHALQRNIARVFLLTRSTIYRAENECSQYMCVNTASGRFPIRTLIYRNQSISFGIETDASPKSK